MRGINLFESHVEFSQKRPTASTVFISHISIDKAYAKKIAEFLMDAGIDVYLDVNDNELQKAVLADDALKITECIEKGIVTCTDVLCLVSESTKQSWWVPYEIGFGKKSSKRLATLTMKDVKDKDQLPPFLRITKILKGAKSLQEYVKSLGGLIPLYEERYMMLRESYSISNRLGECLELGR